MKYILQTTSSLEEFQRHGGGKATNLARLQKIDVNVPAWFCLSSEAFDAFVNEHHLHEKIIPKDNLRAFASDIETLFISLPLPLEVIQALTIALKSSNLADCFVAVRSSGLDEDSLGYSFAGQFSSFLFQKGQSAIETSIKQCWASAFSERGLSYRWKHGLPIKGISMGVVIQQMVDAEIAGVVFSRNPVDLLDDKHLIISSLWGLGEGLVGGALDADHFEIDRESLEIESHLECKSEAFRQAPTGGIARAPVSEDLRRKASLSDDEIKQVAKLALLLEDEIGSPQDCEWAFAERKLYCLQTRPITTLPPAAYYDAHINGNHPTLWDNSNIIESYSGVTSPLTFSFGSNAYRQVYMQFCGIIGVPKGLIEQYQPVFRNMLGLVRGRVYYNLINWYKLVVLLPGTTNNKSFMETMMGVKQGLNSEAADLFAFADESSSFSLWSKLKLVLLTAYRFFTIDTIIDQFQAHFDAIYVKARKTNFKKLSLPSLAAYYSYLDEQILQRWQAPIINDCLCMVFFGLLKKLTEKWVGGNAASSLQNDLLCGQGDLESTEPTKRLMRLAEQIDKGEVAFKQWFMGTPANKIWEDFQKSRSTEPIAAGFADFLDKYGFRCVDELKLESKDLYDDPTFALNALINYVRMKTYSIKEMEEREHQICEQAEKKVLETLSGWKCYFYFWVLKQARRAIRHRENLRFARTKIFGVVRHLFRGMGENLVALKVLEKADDVFYLTVEELFAFIEGRSVGLHLDQLVAIRRKEYDDFTQMAAPPDRLVTYGTAGISLLNSQLLASGNLLKATASQNDDPSLLMGTPCCPGIVEGVVRVVKNLADAEGLNGEILVTERTDPGWVPLYPSCSGLLIERGSLLSHSAVVARELGLPTIVGITGGLTQRLQTGQRVRVDAGKGEIRIL